MRDVSCRVLDIFLRGARFKNTTQQTLVEGTGYSLEHFKNRRERIEWDAYVKFMKNCSRYWTEEQLIEIGGLSFLQNPIIRPLTFVTRVLFTPLGVYSRLIEKDGIAKQLFQCINNEITIHDEKRLTIRLQIRDGLEMCREFFLITLGFYIDLPRLFGLPPAKVEVVWLSNGAEYQIELARAVGSWWSRITVLFSGLTMARELKKANEDLTQQYKQLELSNQVVIEQTQRLEIALAIAQAAQGIVDLDQTLREVARVLVEGANLTGSTISIDTEVGELSIKKSSTFGAIEGQPMHFSLGAGGQPIGTLSIGVGAKARSDEVNALVTAILPNIEMALNHALGFAALGDSRAMLEKRVEARTADLAAALEEVKVQQATRERIFQNISHELRTPLSLISLSSSDIRKRDGSNLSEVSLRRLSDIDDSTGRLLHLFDGMLLLSAGNERRLRIQPIEVDIANVLRGVISAWQLPAEKNDISISYQGPDTYVASADVHAIERVLSNLMSNALKFTPNGGSIAAVLDSTDSNTYEIRVRDTGIGMDPEFLSRVFGRFEQGPSPVRSGERGSGIGLAIVKEIIEEHGGNISVTSAPGAGSTFLISLPRHFAVETTVKQRGSQIPTLAVPGIPKFNDEGAAPLISEPDLSRATTVLIAEDDPGLRRLMFDLLAPAYRVIAVPDGLQALKMAEAYQPALLVSDVAMPHMNGFELTEKFRSLVNDKLAPVILVTAYSVAESRRKGLEVGAIDYVTKPFDAQEFLFRIRNQLKMRELAVRLQESHKLAGLGTLSACLAHELRNPANAVINAIPPLKELLPKELMVEGHPARVLLNALEVCAGQIAHLSRQLLGLTRQRDIDLKEESVIRLVSSANVLVAPLLAGRQIRSQLECVDNVLCAHPLLVQVLVNLLENAIHASPPGKDIVLRTSRQEDWVVFEVCDSGPGVPQALRSQIFDPFFTTKPQGAGTGLGLSISRTIIERHGGTLSLADSPSGAVFRFALRRAGAQMKAIDGAH